MITSRRIYPYVSKPDNALAYAAPVDGASVRLGRSSPNAACFIVNVAGKAGADSLNLALKTSQDGVTWATVPGIGINNINANGWYGIDLNVPLLEYVRMSYGETGADCTATINAYAQADRPIAADVVGLSAYTTGTNGAFCWCKDRTALGTAVVPGGATVYDPANTPVNAAMEAGWWIVDVAGRTVGNVTVTLQWSPDGGATWIDSKATGALAANGRTMIYLDVAVAALIRTKYVGAAGFDGNVTSALYTGSRRDEKAAL